MVDASFQQSFRSYGFFDEVKLSFSGKHKQYGIIVEMAVHPNV